MQVTNISTLQGATIMKVPLILRTMPALLITIVLLGLVAYFSGLGSLIISPSMFLIIVAGTATTTLCAHRFGKVRKAILVLFTRDALTADEASAAGEVYASASRYAMFWGVLAFLCKAAAFLTNLDNPLTWGPYMASAFIAPIYGFALAWLILLPVARLVRDEVA